jgi:hypothetical protein
MYNCNIIITNDEIPRFQDPILLLKILMDTRKKFSENDRQFGHEL